MKVVVSNDAGELFSFTTATDLKGVYPMPNEKPAVLDALAQATAFLNLNNTDPALPPAPMPENPPAPATPATPATPA
jgi:hypothetical protein